MLGDAVRDTGGWGAEEHKSGEGLLQTQSDDSTAVLIAVEARC